MKTPRQLYILVSRSRKRPATGNHAERQTTHTQAYFRHDIALKAANERNAHPDWPETDWRPEKFVKGD